MVHTWIADAAALADERIYQKYYAEVPDFRQRKAAGLRFQEDRALSVAAWTLWQRMQSFYCTGPEAVFNLSHSWHYVICSVSEERNVKVGCDVETVKELRPGIARRFFLPEETRYILEQPAQEQAAEAFYRMWVLKESFMKAVRKGLALDSRSFQIGFTKEDTPVLLSRPSCYPESYFYKEYAVPGVNAKIAVCSTDEEFGKIQIENLD